MIYIVNNNSDYKSIDYETFLNDIRAIIREAMKSDIQESEKLLSGKVACKHFSPEISISTLLRWSEKGWIKSYKIGGKVVYKLSEITEAGKSLKKFKKPTII